MGRATERIQRRLELEAAPRSARICPVLLACFAACATQGPDYAPLHFPGDERIRTEQADNAPPPLDAQPSRQDHSPARQAAEIENGPLCEGTARAAYASDPGQAWSLLDACVRLHDITDIFRLTSEPWLGEIRRRGQDGIILIARVMAHRGGDLGVDVAHANKSGIQVFGLSDAAKNPSIFKHRLVLFRGRVFDELVAIGGRQVHVAETALEAENIVSAYSSRRARREIGKGRRANALRVRRTRGGSGIVVSTQNAAYETGREVMVRVQDDALEFSRTRDYLFLIEFSDASNVSASTASGAAGASATETWSTTGSGDEDDSTGSRATGRLVTFFTLGPPPAVQ
ncbi:MAG: hypothetical protein H6729_02085 [Deltaproteobacteria bacterium]|nr:hypothetical protein [Deltaproteobacteria bacterium]